MTRAQAQLNDELNKRFDDQDEKLNKVISLLSQTLRENQHLRNKVASLERIIARNNLSELSDSDSDCDGDGFSDLDDDSVKAVPEPEIQYSCCPHISVNPEPAGPKKRFDALIISDSIYRHVGKESPTVEKEQQKGPIYQAFNFCNDKVSCLKVVIPGARAPRLFAELVILRKDYVFSEIIIHCGANYIPYDGNYWRPKFWDECYEEVTGLLKVASEMFPAANVTFSPILPQVYSPPKSIRDINININNFCSDHGFTRLHPVAFGEPDAFKFLCYDGTHLSYRGVAELSKVVKHHLCHSFMTDISSYNKVQAIISTIV
jgi:hypothetical protein